MFLKLSIVIAAVGASVILILAMPFGMITTDPVLLENVISVSVVGFVNTMLFVEFCG